MSRKGFFRTALEAVVEAREKQARRYLRQMGVDGFSRDSDKN